MRTILEVFFVSVVPDGFHWIRREIDISQDHQDPDNVVTEYLGYFFSDVRPITERDRYILHSTSWRYEAPRTICLTYIVFAESFRFAHLNPGLLKKSEIDVATTENPKLPRPAKRLTPENVLSHGIRHLAFLVTHDQKRVFGSVIKPETKAYFAQLHTELAGEFR